jgi:hypothetical protein
MDDAAGAVTPFAAKFEVSERVAIEGDPDLIREEFDVRWSLADAKFDDLEMAKPVSNTKGVLDMHLCGVAFT